MYMVLGILCCVAAFFCFGIAIGGIVQGMVGMFVVFVLLLGLAVWGAIVCFKKYRVLNPKVLKPKPVAQMQPQQQVLKPTLSIRDIVEFYDEIGQMRVLQVKRKEAPFTVAYADILTFEHTYKTQTKTKGGVTRALVGGALAGGVGAIVGATTAKTETRSDGVGTTITTKNPQMPIFYLSFLVGPINGWYHTKQKLEEIIARNVAISMQQAAAAPQAAAISSHDELRHLHQLYQDGIITQEEFEGKKQQLLL